MGTPDCTSDPSVCVKRARDTLCMSSPNTGGLSLNASHLWRPVSVLIHRRNRTIMPTKTMKTTGANGLSMIVDSFKMINVGAGKVACNEVNSFWNVGTTKISNAMKMTAMTHSTTTG